MSWPWNNTGVSRLHKNSNDEIRQALGGQTSDNSAGQFVQRRLRWFGDVETRDSVERLDLPVEGIPHDALLARFEGKRKKNKARLHRIGYIGYKMRTYSIS